MSKRPISPEPGIRIRSLREKLGMTRLQFHKKTGISASTLRALEVGEIALTPSKALIISNMFIYVLKSKPKEAASQETLLYGEQRKKRKKKKKRTPKTAIKD
jgi:transcriptional regulator with XRE-family HTH domain